MPAYIKRLTATGLVDVAYSATSLSDAATRESQAGVYTVSNTYHVTQTLLLGAHLDRLEDSARREHIDLRLDRARLRRSLRQMILEAGFGDVRFRITVPAAAPDSLTITLEPFEPPATALLHKGARCIATSALARRNPAAKSSDWMRQREALLAATPAGIYEVFLVGVDGGILEGSTSNFYAIKDGILHTAGKGMLAGISRKIVLTVGRGIVPICLEAPCLADLPAFSEAFLSSSSRGLIPVVEIDGRAIGKGKVGPVTQAMRRAYDSWVAQHLEEL